MTKKELKRFNELYEHHLLMLKLQGKSPSTIDGYSRAIRRIRKHFDCCPDKLTLKQLEVYFGEMIDTFSWSTVKIDRVGLQFFWEHVLKRDWQWLNMVKPPRGSYDTRYSYHFRNRKTHWSHSEIKVSSFFIDHLLNGTSLGRSLISSSF